MIKKVMVYLYGDADQSFVVEAASQFATEHSAELCGLFVTPDFLNYSTVYGAYPINFSQTLYEIEKDYARKAHEKFNQIVEQYDCNATWYETTENQAENRLALYSDYLFVAQPDKEGGILFDDNHFIDKLIIETGLPTIVIPEKNTTKTIGKRPMIGWKETREAAGAIRHTLSLMRGAEDVDVVSVYKNSNHDKEFTHSTEIGAYLTSHEVNCKIFNLDLDNNFNSVTKVLLNHAAEQSRDLIIIGGYGHSRLREIILGGVTRGLIRTSPVPVLLSH